MAEEGGGGGIIAQLAILLHVKVDEKEKAEADGMFESLKKGLEYFAGYEAVKGLFELVEHTTEAAVGSKHLAEKLGTTIEAVQELSYAADVTGASTQAMQSSMQHLSLAMSHAAKTGSGPLVEALSKLKVPFKEIEKGKVDENLETIAEAFKNAGPEVNKTAMAMQIFGRQGTALLPLLNKGKDGVKELREEFVALGDETSAEDAEKLEQLEEQQKKIKYLWDGIKFQAVMALLPALKEVTTAFFEWVKANRELIASSLTTLIHALTEAMGALAWILDKVVKAFAFITQDGDAVTAILIAVGGAIGIVAAAAAAAWLEGKLTWGLWIGLAALVIYGIIKIYNWFSELSTPLQVLLGVLTAIGIVVAYMMIDSFALVVLMIWGMVEASWALLAANAWWAWLPALIGLVIFAIVELYEHFDEIADWVKGLGQEIEDFFGNLLGSIKDSIVHSFDFIKDAWDSFKADHPWIARALEGAASVVGIGDDGASGDASDAATAVQDRSVSGGDSDNPNRTSNQTASITIEQHIHPTPGMSEERIGEISAEKTKEVLDDHYRQSHADAGLNG